MELNMENFLKTLFDPVGKKCFTENEFGIKLSRTPHKNDVYFSINEMHTSRKDQNVTCFRNFLIEIDNMPLSEQIAYVYAGLPADLITSIVFSGGKSYHFIISLETPLKNIEEYQIVAKRLHLLFPRADSTSKNPSRLSRLPFRARPNSLKQQVLVKLGTRVDNKELISRLPELKFQNPETKLERKTNKLWMSALLSYALEQPDEFMAERGFAGRNHFFFFIYNRLKEEGFANDDIRHYIDHMYSRLKNKTDFTLQEAYTAARVSSSNLNRKIF